MADNTPTTADAMLNGSTHQTPSTADIAKEYDLLPKLIPHLDRHLAFPMLSFKEEEGLADPEEVLKMKFTLLKDINMVDYVADLDMQIHGLKERPAEYSKKREEVMQRRALLDEETSQLRNLLDDPDVVSNLRSDKVANLNYLKETHGITNDMVNLLYDYGQFLYSTGDYQTAEELLYRFRVLSTDNDRVTNATWGKLACEILQGNWDTAMEEIQKVRDTIETRFFNAALTQLHHRTWLLHWSLFPFFLHEPSRDTLIELFFTPAYINTIQTSCPWLLRYLAAAVISGRNKTGGGKNVQGGGSNYQKQVKDLVRIIRQEGYEYKDPMTEFIKALYVDFDFEEAQRRLRDADEVLRGDFFLLRVADAFVEAARHLISESYCKIHQRIDIKDLSTRLGLSQDEGEKWIVNLIRDTRVVDAKIDYKEGTVIMNHPPQSVYQQVIERTKGGFFRTQVLSAAVGK